MLNKQAASPLPKVFFNGKDQRFGKLLLVKSTKPS